jgi:hypothetical protein
METGCAGHGRPGACDGLLRVAADDAGEETGGEANQSASESGRDNIPPSSFAEDGRAA